MSCRRGVKDGDCGCCKSLAAKVRELYQRCANAIKSINGINPDGANNFDILAGAGIQVNPRANGIEIVNTGALPPAVDSVETINQIAPDANHDFAITAGSGIQINAGTNGIEIENISQGAVYTGISPIQISASNEISLKGWTVYDSTDWSVFKDANRTITEDLILIVATQYHSKTYYLPKGLVLVASNECQLDIPYTNEPGCFITVNMDMVLSNNSASTTRYYMTYTNSATITTPSTFKTTADSYWTLRRRTATGSTLFQSNAINAAIMVRR